MVDVDSEFCKILEPGIARSKPTIPAAIPIAIATGITRPPPSAPKAANPKAAPKALKVVRLKGPSPKSKISNIPSRRTDIIRRTMETAPIRRNVFPVKNSMFSYSSTGVWFGSTSGVTVSVFP
jgi:hypothetical protein